MRLAALSLGVAVGAIAGIADIASAQIYSVTGLPATSLPGSVPGSAPGSLPVSPRGRSVLGEMVPIDQGFDDVSPLGGSLRFVPIDLRQPSNFQTVFRLPGGSLARRDGGLTAVFPQSTYYQIPRTGGTYATVPPGSVFAIGEPPAWLVSGASSRSAVIGDGWVPDGAPDPRVSGRQNLYLPGRLSSQIDGRIDLRLPPAQPGDAGALRDAGEREGRPARVPSLSDLMDRAVRRSVGDRSVEGSGDRSGGR